MSTNGNSNAPDEYDFQPPDASFNLRQGLRLLIIVVVIVVIITLICTYLARR